jgi:helicase
VPTSAGKSLIAEIAITTFLNRNQESRAIWIVPSRALVSEVFLRLRKRFKRIGISVSTSVGGVELTPGETAFDQGAKVLVVTPEKLDGLLRRVTDLLNVPTLVVFDEMHKIADTGRGWFLESVIAWMLLKASRDERIKLLFMSAVLPNVNIFESWLSVGEERSESITSSWRPTRLALFSVKEANYGRSVEIYLHQQNSNTFIVGQTRAKTSGHQYRIPVEFVDYLVNKEATTKSILVFYYTKNDLNTFIGTLVQQGVLEESESPELQALSEKFGGIYGPEHAFTQAVRQGVGIDHGDLPIWLRGMVEEAFRNQSLKILVANQVILEGVNFPIDDMLVCSLGSLGRDSFNYRLRKQDFINLIGRVGRALVNTEGRCFIFRPWIYTRSPAEQQEWQSYIDLERSPDAHSTMMLDDDELLPVLQALTAAIEAGEDDIFAGIRRWREPLERLYSVVLGVAANPDGDRYDQINNLVRKTLAYQEVGPDSKRGIRRFVRAVDDSIEAADVELYSLAALSGLSVASARAVRNLVNEIIDSWNQDDQGVEPTFENIISNESFGRVSQLRECYRPITYGTRPWRARIDQYSATCSWLNGENWEQVSTIILREHPRLAPNTKAQIVASYVSQMFEYRLPWALSGVALAAKELGAPGDLQQFLDSLPSFVRFGVTTTPLC